MPSLLGLRLPCILSGAFAGLVFASACGASGAAPAASPAPAPASEAPAAAPPRAAGATGSDAGETDEALLPVPKGARRHRGRASFYSDKLSGRATASGEPYDPHALTAAHRSLPFGTVVDVTGPEGKRVQVRINDRGPFRRGRIIDLSRAAAERLGMVRAGVVEVTMRVVHRPPPKPRRKRHR